MFWLLTQNLSFWSLKNVFKVALRHIALSLLALVHLTALAADNPTVDEAKLQPDNLFPKVQMVTTMGTIVVELNRIKAPDTVDNFLKYVVLGEYNNTAFHRVIKGFVVQGGGLDGNYNAKPERFDPIHNEAGNGLKNDQYSIAMARQNHPHSATRQFFFNMDDNKSLDPGSRSWGYTVFGSIVQGEDVVDAISEVETTTNVELGWSDVPVTPVILKEATLLPEGE